MADDEMNTGTADAAVNEENLIGRKVRISPDAKDTGTDNPHFLAGLYGEINRPSPFGGWMVTVGKKTKHFDLADLELLPASGGDTEAEIAPAETPTSAETQLVVAPPLQAICSLTNPRRRRGLEVESLRALADNIKTHGIAQPILARLLPASRLEETAHLDPRPWLEVIAGERRWRSAQLAELPMVPFFVREMSDQAVLEIQLVENIEREDLDAMEEAEGFALLRDKLGYTVDQIAERIGKGKGVSYVRKTMKLLELTPESREAMYDGHLGRSTGLLVARYPAERQAAVVAFIRSQAVKTPNGQEPAPFRVVAPALHTRFNTTLKDAAFDIDDPVLVMAAGACTVCPKRTGQAQDLFGDDEKVEASCTDDACYAAKKAAHVQRVHLTAQSEGCKVIDGDEALKIKPSPYSSYLDGYTRIDSTASTVVGEDGKEREVTFEDALRGMGRKAPKPIVLIDPHTSKAIKVIPDELADKLMPEGEGTNPGVRPGKVAPHVDTRPPEEIAWSNSLVRRAALIRAFDAIRTRPRSIDELRLVARALMAEEQPGVEGYMGWGPDLEPLHDQDEIFQLHREKIEAMDADQVGQLIAMAAIETACTSWIVAEPAHVVLKAYDIDLIAVSEKVNEDLARQRAEGTENDDALGIGPDDDQEAA